MSMVFISTTVRNLITMRLVGSGPSDRPSWYVSIDHTRMPYEAKRRPKTLDPRKGTV